MTDDRRTDYERMTDAVAATAAAQATARPPALASWKMARDESMEQLTKLSDQDPAAYAAMRPPTVAHGVYTAGRKAAAAAFRWQADLELALSQRAAGATFSPGMTRAIEAYARDRENAEQHGVLDAARQRAEKGA